MAAVFPPPFTGEVRPKGGEGANSSARPLRLAVLGTSPASGGGKRI